LELHLALRSFVAAPGDPRAHSDLTNAARRHPDLAHRARRLERGRARPGDWIAIARADRLSTWPQFESLQPKGRHSARTLVDLRRIGVLETDRDDPDRLGVIRRARITRSGRAVAVGVVRRGQAHFVPTLSVLNCSPAFRWSSLAEPDGAGTVAVLATRHRLTSYWHWVHEGLLELIDLEGRSGLPAIERTLVCLDKDPPSFVADSLRAAGLDRSRIELTTEPFDIGAERLILPNWTVDACGMVDHPVDREAAAAARSSYDRHRDDAMHELRARIGVPDRCGDGRLYVSRRDASRRRVVNETDLLRPLLARGFEIVSLDGRSFADQVDLFRSAAVVVAPHGAGLTNLLFTGAGTRVLELQERGAERPHFRRLAAAVGAEYRSVACVPDPRRPRDMVVDVTSALAVLNDLLDQ
jgi:hypothetical protein